MNRWRWPRGRGRAGIGLALVAAMLASASFASAGTAGSAGVDTSIPSTDSAVTVAGRPCPGEADGCGFQDLRVTVNQTRDLLNQAVSVTWTGGAPTSIVGGNVFGNFLQIFQCWGDADGTHPENPGPSPDTCEFGGFQSNGKALSALFLGSQNLASRIISSPELSTFDPADGYVDTAQDVQWKPFRAVDGTVVNISVNFNASTGAVGEGAYWRNGFFNYYTTNEDVVAPTHPDGTGSELFTLQTGLESAGLGCGQKVEPFAGAASKVPKCWLVVVPRSTGAQENPPEHRYPGASVEQSPLAPSAWKNRIAVPLDFRPIDTTCTIGADERRIAGSELAVSALTSWQPRLCANPGSPPYSYTALSDDQTRGQLVAGAEGSAGLGIVSRPVEPGRLDPDDPVTYAPLALSGVVIGFNVERVPNVDGRTGLPTDPEESPISGVRVASIDLTPRLVAKMLTQSYRSQFGNFSPHYPWIDANPVSLAADPDFVRYNPEFAQLAPRSPLGRLVLEQPSADAAYELWRWVLADPEARTWMAGAKDQWGMTVNPVYNTDRVQNPSGVGFGDPVPGNYPKSDPFCYQSHEILVNIPDALPRLLCMLDIAPYVNSMVEAAQAARTANDGSKTSNDNSVLSPELYWKPNGPQVAGNRAMMAVTDAASAARFGLQTAHLSRAGDDGAGREFVAADQGGLLAGLAAMKPSADAPEVLEPDPASTRAGAYPLAMLTYGATRARSLDAAARVDYANFLAYAVGDGQQPGLGLGQLPLGYAPLPLDLRLQSVSAIIRILAGDPAPPVPVDQPASVDMVVPAAAVAPVVAVAAPATQATTSTAVPVAPAPPVVAATDGAGAAPPPPPAAPKTPAPPTVEPRRSMTPADRAGFVRFAVPIVAGLGLLSLLGMLVLDDRWQRALLSRVKPRPPTPSTA